MTIRVAEAVLPVPPLVELTLPVVLTNTPPLPDATNAVTVQLLLAASEPPVRLRVLPKLGADAVPPHELVRPGSNVLPIPPDG